MGRKVLVNSDFGLSREQRDALIVETPPKGIPSANSFQEFVEEASHCADDPLHSVVHTSPINQETMMISASKVEKKWKSEKPRDIDDVTLCTQLDHSRLPMLRGQCRAWNGPISAAVYQPLIKNMDAQNDANILAITDEIEELFQESENRADGCILDIVFLVEMRYEDEAWAYPYNSNRNHAIARAQTRLVFLLDVDFLPNYDLHDALTHEDTWESILEATHKQRKVFVVPAFETNQSLKIEDGISMASEAASASKHNLKAMFDRGDIVQFAPFFKRGHGATNYTLWFSSSNEPYRIIPEVGYEPFIILSRVHVPWFDERFRGYGWDKITHIYHLNRTGFRFEPIMDGWVCHRPHKPSAAYSKTFTGPAYTTKHKPTEELKKLDVIAKEFMLSIRKKLYPARGVTALESCRPLELLTSDYEEADSEPPQDKIRNT